MKNVLIFVLGAGVGSLVTWKLVEVKYKKLADEEIKSVVDRFKQREEEKNTPVKGEENTVEETEEKIEFTEEEKAEYKEQVKNLGYSNDVEVPEEHAAPYVIAPEEYGEGYETRSWTLYADGIITDEDDMIVDDPEIYIGDALSHFGEYEDNAVYVRNEKEEYDYEILRHIKPYSEIYKGVN